MYTDWVIVRRLAAEIDARLRGAKVREIGMLADGRTALMVWSRGTTSLLCIDLFGSPPLVTLEAGEVPIAPEPGFLRAAGAALRDTTVLAVRARKHDRLMRLTFGTRSRFGIGDELDLYVELVPRFGNLVLVKGERIVAAAKEFSLADNGTRAVQAGLTYQLPPLHVRPPLAPEADAALLEGDAVLREPVYVYRRDGRIVQSYVLPLTTCTDAQMSRAPSLLDTLRDFRENRDGEHTRRRSEIRRAAMLKELDLRERRVRDERAAIDAKRHKALERERLREAGATIYGTLHELSDDAARDEAKAHAAKLFAEYRKLGASLPHLDERERVLCAQANVIETLRWEVERAGDDEIADVERAVIELQTHRARTHRELDTRRRRRTPLEVHAPGGSRILIGRSPSENADLTFRVARPNDLWFHAKDLPGAHVVLQRDDREDASDDDIAIAAAYAAYHSKARASAKVSVDYTLRKYVRKHKDAPPGLVWYTDFKTIVVAPKEPVAQR